MTISYNWLHEYLPVKIEPERLSKILTSIGLEVESMELFEEIRGGYRGLVVGEVISCEKHPNADKLSLTKVDIGQNEPLSIVCGAPNVAKGQKVVVAPVGTTIFPFSGEPVKMKQAKIRGEESQGMICAADEIGISDDHSGVLVLPPATQTGMPVSAYFKPFSDHVYEIGLTPNRMDAMSHLGVAKDLCAYMSHHENKNYAVKSPFPVSFKPDAHNPAAQVVIENAIACQRYSGIVISGVTVKESPKWLQLRLKSIGLRPINNIVDITNFILHETGQPLHAFDAADVKGNKIIVKNLDEGTPFVTLDEKVRKLSKDDLMICNGDSEPMCIGGVFGGLNSGVKADTRNIFLESAWFNPATIRKTSLRHGLRTDAATRFEKGVDISNCVNVLKRAALLIREVAGGTITTDAVDEYPDPKPKVEVGLKFHYLKKLSGKNYHSDSIKKILEGLGFVVIKEGIDEIRMAVPYSKSDIRLPADVVEEVMRIDGLDNVEIPASITISPSVESLEHELSYQEKISDFLAGGGFNEILTNSITNSRYFPEEVLQTSVKMINNLSAELDIMRPSMLETGLECISYNLNRKNQNLRFFEFGKTYWSEQVGNYREDDHLCLYLTGLIQSGSWKSKPAGSNFYWLKGWVEAIFKYLGVSAKGESLEKHPGFEFAWGWKKDEKIVAVIGEVKRQLLNRFDIKQPVFHADLNWKLLLQLNQEKKISVKEVPRFPAVQRDLSMIVGSELKYESIEKAALDVRNGRLQKVDLFDIFESDKLGKGKKSMAVSFTFQDEEKTLTDQEVDQMMQQIMRALESRLKVEIRKS